MKTNRTALFLTAAFLFTAADIPLAVETNAGMVVYYFHRTGRCPGTMRRRNCGQGDNRPWPALSGRR